MNLNLKIGEMTVKELEEIIGHVRSDYKLERKIFVSLIKDKE